MSGGLQLRDLRAAYPRGPEVLRGVDLEVAAGRTTALIGPNGCGKSTLLRAILGTVPVTGEVRLDGADLASLPLRERARRIAYVPQRTRLTARLSVESVVALGRFASEGGLAGRSASTAAAVDAALDATDARGLAGRVFAELSGGEQQRVLLARALATGAETLLLDEPTSSQDVGHALDLHGILRRLADDGRTILVVLHDLAEVQRHADTVAVLDAGRVRITGPAATTVLEPEVGAVYGVAVESDAGLGYRRLEGESHAH